jgi:hypothetical protein
MHHIELSIKITLNAKELVITIIRGAREVGAKSRLGDT